MKLKKINEIHNLSNSFHLQKWQHFRIYTYLLLTLITYCLNFVKSERKINSRAIIETILVFKIPLCTFMNSDQIMMSLKWYMMDAQSYIFSIQCPLAIYTTFIVAKKSGVWQPCHYVWKVIKNYSTLVRTLYKFNWVNFSSDICLFRSILKQCCLKIIDFWPPPSPSICSSDLIFLQKWVCFQLAFCNKELTVILAFVWLF